MSFWNWVASSLADWEELIAAVMPLSVRVGGVQMSREEVAARAWADPSGPEAIAARTYIDAATFELTLGQADAMNNGLQDQAERVWRDGSRSVGGSFGLRVSTDMVQLVIPNTYRVSIEATSGGQQVVNVIGVAAPTGSAAQVAAAVLAAWKATNGPMSILTTLYQMTGVRALDLSGPNGDIAFLADASLGTNGTAGQKATNAASALVKWNGGTRSRSSRGRLYFGPLGEAQVDQDGRTLNATARSQVQAAFGVFRNSLTNASFPLVVISPTLMQSFPVTSHAVETIIATQRRRIRN